MVSTLCLLACALAPVQTGDWQLQPRLTRGQELIYRGLFTEEELGEGVHYQRAYQIDTRVLVLDASNQNFELGILTTVTSNAGKPGLERPTAPAPASSVRLEVVGMDRQGRFLTAAAAKFATPLDRIPTIECGAFLEVPKGKVSLNASWGVNEEGRPPRTWRVDGTELVNNVLCVRLVGVQQAEDWDNPRADNWSWHRRDTVWISSQQALACRYEREIKRRVAARQGATHRTVFRCDLESGITYHAKLFENRHHEITQARKFYQEADALLREPQQHKHALQTLLKKIKLYLENEAETPYRKAILQVQSRTESALRGDTIPDPEAHAPAPPPARVVVGRPLPDFVCPDLITRGTFRLQSAQGKPVVIMFYNPAYESAQVVLRFGQTLAQRFPAGVTILPMAVTDYPDQARKQHKEMQLPFSILDGNGLLQLFAVDALPRLVVLDARGVVQEASTGWGQHTANDINRLLQKLGPR